jgi:hypothetical protein
VLKPIFGAEKINTFLQQVPANFNFLTNLLFYLYCPCGVQQGNSLALSWMWIWAEVPDPCVDIGVR